MPRIPASIPKDLDLVIVHQFDAARSSPGGIDTCIRGIARYAGQMRVGIVGVDATADRNRALGSWEQHTYGDSTFWFMPVARLDPASQVRRLPHSLRLMGGVARYRKRIPRAAQRQSHRMDVGLATNMLLGGKSSYFIHTQDQGLTGTTSDSFWKYAAAVHRRLERRVTRRASRVVVFNPDYIATVRQWNPAAQFSPTWFDPAVLAPSSVRRVPGRIVWVGRLETPKDPILAVAVFAKLAASGEHDAELEIVGDGSLHPGVAKAIEELPPDLHKRVHLRGRLAPDEVATVVRSSSVFLMTSHPGYEGYPRVLVEAMAAGTIPVVTQGSDTGGLVQDGVTGYTTSRDPAEIASRIRDATREVDRDAVIAAVAALSAPAVISSIYPAEQVHEAAR